MRLLLDTHALIWFADGNKHFSERAKTALDQPDNDVFVSLVTVWEIGIKISLGKLRLRLRIEDELKEFLAENEFQLLHIDYSHVARVASLPFKHRDPFDRLLVAQTEIEQMTIISHDDILDAYDVNRLW